MPDKFFPIFFQTDPGGGSGSDGGTGDNGGSGGDGGSQEDNGDGGSNSDDGSANDQTPTELKKVRDEAAKSRRELRAAQKRIEELEGAQKTETERLSDAQTKLTQELDTERARNRRLIVRALAPQAGIAASATGDAADLFKPSDSLDWDDESSVLSELKSFVKERPHLAAARGNGADGGEGGNRDEAQDMNSLIRSAAGRG